MNNRHDMKKQIYHESADQIPYTIKSTQEWFASIITNRLGDNGGILPYSPSGNLIAEEAARYIVPSPTLQPHQRMQIYNQQYWWRLLNTLHTNFPLTVRLFGTHAFNEKIGIPYLLKSPPYHWSLCLLGESLPKWVEENYQEPDRLLIHHAALLDLACISSFVAPQLVALDPLQLQDDPENMLGYTFYLQPCLHLFAWEYDLVTFRGSFLKQPVDYWLEHRFPELPKGKTYRFVLYRNEKKHLVWREIEQAEFLLLQCFKKGTSLVQICEYIESQEPPLAQQMSEHLETWLKDWTQAKWLTLATQKEDRHG